jgi:1,4-dihydroxy-6-naphthoate synthase
MTTAYLALRLFQSDFQSVVMPFDQIMGAVERREVDAGLLIHEGQLTYRQAGLHKVLDLGEWWHDRTGLPLPLGGNGIRRDLGQKHIIEVAHLIKESIRYGLAHREEALEHALKYARGLNSGEADRFVSMYVNDRTLDYGEDGRRAVRLLLEEAYLGGVIPRRVEVDFVE